MHDPDTRRRIHATVIILVLFVTTSMAMIYRKLVSPPVMSPEQMQQQGAWMLETPRIFRDIVLTDHQGKPFTNANFKGKWSLVFFGFTYCPDICPTTLGVMNRFYNALKKTGRSDSVQVVLVTVDPARDTPQKLKDYVTYFNPDFIGVTGEFMALQGFANDLNAAFTKVPGGGENYLVEHSGNIVLVNPYGHYHGFFKPPHDPERLLRTFSAARAAFD